MNTAKPGKLFTTLLLIALPVILSANGGGIHYSRGRTTGNIHLDKNRNIFLEKEVLYIEVDGDYSIVSVKYNFNNKGMKKSLLYGFPVTCSTCVEKDEKTGAVTGEPVDSIDWFTMKFNGNDVKADKLDRSYEMHENISEDFVCSNASLNRWYIAKLEFPAGKSTLEISYRVENSFSDNIETKGCFNRYSNREFCYILSPSGSWGAGIASEFDVTVDFTKAENQGFHFVNIEGLKLTKIKDTYAGRFKKFNMIKAKPLIVSYNVTDAETRKLMESPLRPGETGSDGLYNASSFKTGCGPAHAFDGTPSTAWVEGSGKGGAGEWIEINRYLHGIAIVNGMTASKELYYKYSRIKKLRIDLFYSKTGNRTFEINLEDKKYPEHGVNPKEFYTVLYSTECGDGSSPLGARITVLDVYPGTEFKEACISDIYLIFFRSD